MSTPGTSLKEGPRPPDDPMSPALDRLHECPSRFGFFQAVRLLYGAHRFDGRGSGGAQGPLRFVVPTTLAFPPSELDELIQGEDALKLRVNFMGLTGPSGVLPYSYTDWLISRGVARDRSAQDFLDIFNHRVVSLFWLAWAKHRPEVSREFGFRNSVLQYLEYVIGMGTPALQARLHPRAKSAPVKKLPGAAMVYFSGLIAQRPHGEHSIVQVVSDLADAPVRGEGCLGAWKPIPQRDRTRLGREAHRIGDGCILGTRYWDRQDTLRLTIGPLTSRRYHALLPRGQRLNDVVALTRFLAELSLDLRIRLSLRADEVPPLRLGARDGEGPQLGWNTWLRGRRSQAPAEDCEFHFSALGGQSWH